MFKDFKHKFTTDPYFKFRTISICLAILLGICSILLVFLLFGVLFGVGFSPNVLGLFFAQSFGILSLLIPAYLAYAAFILADPKWRPDRIFILICLIIPFFTLAVGYSFINDFEERSLQSGFLNFTGKTGFSMLIIFITVIEVLFIQVLKKMLFNKEDGKFKTRAGFLPPPSEAPIQQDENFSYQVARQNYFEKDVEKNIIEAPIVSIVSETDLMMHHETSEESDVEELDAETSDNEDEEKETEIEDSDAVTSAASVARLLEEAEAAAAAHAEQVRSRKTGSTRYKKYNVPVDILNEYPDGEYWVIDQATKDAAIALKETLEEFKIQAEVTGIRKGPVITMFEILPAPGVKLSKIVGLQDNIALRLAASSVRIVAPIPGKHAVGIEVPNAKRNIVSFKEIIEHELQSEKKMELPVVMGKDITGEAQTVDLVQMPHILIAGATGSGKSVCVNSIILSLLYQLHPAHCRLMLIDPKIVELKLYNDIPHLLTPVITESKKAFQALQYCIYEMERRYACLDSMGVRDIRSYNRRIKEKNVAQEHMPYIVVVIDEFADLMTTTGKELESTVARLAAMSRAVGIHLVLATQRPSIDVITGLIKANIPSRIAFMVASKTDSRIIIDMVGAEKLLGKGDMLYSGVVDPFPIRMQGAFVSEEEVEAVVEHVKTFGAPDYIDEEIFYEEEEDDSSMSLFSDGGDPLYEKALEIVMQQGKASASFIQRRLKIGFNRAARLIDEMEHNGVVGPAQGSKPRELIRSFGI
ncbi:MAG: DNA translocase FtsK [Treponema sp.]|nr:DNA translocase FtsK [Treponema sp.]